MKNKYAKAVGVLLCAAMCMTGCGKVDGTQTVLTVDDNTCSLGAALFDLRYQQSEMYSYYEQMYQMYGMSMDEYWDTETEASSSSTTSETSSGSVVSSSSGETTTYGEQFKDQVMDNLKEMLVMKGHADEYDVKVTDEDEKNIEKAAKQFIEDNDEEMLTANGITQDSVEEYMELYTIYTRMHDPMIADVDTNVTDDEAQMSTVTYVKIAESEDSDSSSSDSSTTSEAEVQTAPTYDSLDDEAKAILDRLKEEKDIANADIDSIATELGSDATTVTASYDSDDEAYDSAMKEAANTLKDGELYDGVITGTDGNLYLVRMDSVFDQDKTDENKTTIVEERQTEAYRDLIDGWEEDAKITVNESAWKKAKVQDKDQYRIKEEESSSVVSETSETSEAGSVVSETGSVVSETSEASGSVVSETSQTSSVVSDAAASSTTSEAK